jgi:hypothetical protein
MLPDDPTLADLEVLLSPTYEAVLMALSGSEELQSGKLCVCRLVDYDVFDAFIAGHDYNRHQFELLFVVEPTGRNPRHTLVGELHRLMVLFGMAQSKRPGRMDTATGENLEMLTDMSETDFIGRSHETHSQKQPLAVHVEADGAWRPLGEPLPGGMPVCSIVVTVSCNIYECWQCFFAV